MKVNCHIPSIAKENGSTSTDLHEFVTNLLNDTKRTFTNQSPTVGPSSTVKTESARSRRSRIKENAYVATATIPQHTNRKSRRISEK